MILIEGWTHELGSTDALSIWGQFAVGCYSFGDLARPVSLAILGVPGPMGPTGDGSRERLLGESVSWLTKDPG